jgi:CheY-like chemotaxis protein
MTNTDILYIEDNFHNRRIVRKILERQGYTLHECEDGLEGYEMLKSMKPGIVLLDISLPSMDGMEIAGLVKADPELEHIYLVALTASAMQGDRERFLEGGCDDYLSKPFRALDLVDLVGRYMDIIKGEASFSEPRSVERPGEREPVIVRARPVPTEEVESRVPDTIEETETEKEAVDVDPPKETEEPVEVVAEEAPVETAEEEISEKMVEAWTESVSEASSEVVEPDLAEADELKLAPEEPKIASPAASKQNGKKARKELIKEGILGSINPENIKPANPNG